MSETHYRRCHDCGAINKHTDNIAPEVCCKRCKSQDTRLMKCEQPPLWMNSLARPSGVYVATGTACCPECGSGLIAECLEHEVESGRPVATGIELHCITDMEGRLRHSYQQHLWQPMRDRVVKWCDARVD